MKAELRNAFMLFRIRFRDAQRGMALALTAMAILVVFDLVRNMIRISESFGGYSHNHLPDYSVFLLILTPLVIAYTCWQEAAGKNSIYPQTSMSRFISTLMLSFFLVLLALVAVLVLYGLLYLFFAFMGLWHSNIVLGYSFDAGFLLQGFLAAFAFLGMITIAIVCVSFLVRNFKMYAVVPILGLMLFGMLYPTVIFPSSIYGTQPIDSIFRYFAGLFDAILEPRTLLSFLLTCISISAAILLITFFIRLLVKRDRDSGSVSWMLTVVYVPWILIMLTLGTLIYSEVGLHFSPRFGSDVYPLEQQSVEAQIPKGGGLYLDIAGEHRDNESFVATVIEVRTDGVYIDVSDVYASAQFINTQSDTYDEGIYERRRGLPLPEPQPGLQNVRVDYIPPSFDFTSRALLKVARPEINMHIEDNTLTVRHTIEGEAEVVFIPIWSMMGLIEENRAERHPRLEISSP